jgi:outer membrane putative beta-barrel porin/alpha-amylase
MKRTAALGTLLVALAWASGAWAARPLDTEDAGTLDPGNAEVELGGDYARNSEDALWILRGTFSAGILPRLEARFELPVGLVDPDGPRSSFAGVADALVGAKYRFVDERPTLPALMAAVALRLPTGDPDRGRGREASKVTPLGVEGVDVTVVGIVGKAIGPVILHGNAAYTFVTGDRDADFAALAASAEYRLTNALSLVAEVLGFLLVRDAGLDVGRVRGGVSYAIRNNIKLDAAVGRGLGRDSPSLLVTAGVTFAF